MLLLLVSPFLFGLTRSNEPPVWELGPSRVHFKTPSSPYGLRVGSFEEALLWCAVLWKDRQKVHSLSCASWTPPGVAPKDPCIWGLAWASGEASKMTHADKRWLIWC